MEGGSRFQNIRVYCQSSTYLSVLFPHLILQGLHSSYIGALCYSDIICTWIFSSTAFRARCSCCLTFSSVGGGIVNHPYFQHHFGMYNADGTKNTHKVNNISSNVVSSFQAGAFFGALGSVPISRKPLSLTSSIRKFHFRISKTWKNIHVVRVLSSLLYRCSMSDPAPSSSHLSICNERLDSDDCRRIPIKWPCPYLLRAGHIWCWNRWYFGCSSSLCLRMFAQRSPRTNHRAVPDHAGHWRRAVLLHKLCVCSSHHPSPPLTTMHSKMALASTFPAARMYGGSHSASNLCRLVS